MLATGAAPSLFDRLLTPLEIQPETLLGSIVAKVVLGVLLCVLFRRHTLLYYGSPLSSVLGIILLALALITLPTTDPLGPALCYTMIMVFMIEALLNSLGHQKRFFALFNVGFLLAILITYHSAAIFMIIYIITMMVRLQLHSLRHLAALLLGLFSGLWILILFFAPTSTKGLVDLINFKINQLGLFSFNTDYSYAIIAATTLLIVLSLFTYYFRRTAIERHRFFSSSHLALAWTFLLIHSVYCTDQPFSFFYITMLFFAMVPISIFFATAKDPIWYGIIGLPLIALLSVQTWYSFM